MRLYITLTSPYARLARIMVIEKGLEDSVEIIQAQTRSPGSSYYDINPSGRVPYLERDDGVGMEGSDLICAYLDNCDGNPEFGVPNGTSEWEAERLEARARSFLDGLAVWRREFYRDETERSPALMKHEKARSERLAGFWEREVQHPLLIGKPNRIQLTLVCALQMENLIPEFAWRAGHPHLCAFEARLAGRSSVAKTVPAGS